MKKYVIAILALILVEVVIGIGVGPVRTDIEFEPNLKSTYGINVFNTDNKAMIVSLSLSGEVDEYINLESGSVEFSANESEKRISFNVSFPRDVPPGTYNGKLNILSSPVAEGTIVASLGVTHDISLFVPAHGKFIRETIERLENAVRLSIENIGVKNIEVLQVESNIIDSTSENKFEFSESNFEPDEVVVEDIPVDVPVGRYLHEIIIHYDNLSKEINNPLIVGEIELEIIDVVVEEFIVGQITEVLVETRSNWNEELGVFLEADLIKDEVLETSTSQVYQLKDEAVTSIFFDMEGVEEGDYTFKVRIFHDGDIAEEKDFRVKLKEPVPIIDRNITRIGILLVVIIILLLALAQIIKKHSS